MKFFIPDAESKESESSVYNAIVEFAKTQTGWEIGEKKVYRVSYRHNGKHYEAQVGEEESRELGGEKVIAILESNTYLVCTPNRGVVRGAPCMVGLNEIISVEYFEE